MPDLTETTVADLVKSIQTKIDKAVAGRDRAELAKRVQQEIMEAQTNA